MDLTLLNSTPLKTFSLVSWKWRRIVLPLLFRFLRIPLDENLNTVFIDPVTLDSMRSQQSQLSPHELQVYQEHKDLLERMEQGALPRRQLNALLEIPVRVREEDQLLKQCLNLRWLPYIATGFEDFLEFLSKFGLKEHVKSVAVYTGKTNDSPINELMKETVHKLWDKVFTNLDPSRFVIAAPPSTMQILLLLHDLSQTGDAEAFGMDMHYVAFFAQDADLVLKKRHSPPLCTEEITHRKPWTHLAYNEGSSVAVYSTYEYHNRTPPTMLPKILYRLMKYELLRSFSFTGIFPFNNVHLGTIITMLRCFPTLRELRFQLAPGPESDLLSVPNKLGRAQASDLWLEWDEGYETIVDFLDYHSLDIYSMALTFGDGVKFTSGDCGQVRVAMDVEKHMESLRKKGKGWRKEEEEGVWVRDSTLDQTPEPDSP